jgi:hypothetical protein
LKFPINKSDLTSFAGTLHVADPRRLHDIGARTMIVNGTSAA